MAWFKIITFVLSAIIAIGGLYLTEPNKPRLALFLSILIIISVIVGIVLEVKDVKSKKQQQDEVVAQNTELLGKIENLNDQNKELIAGKNEVVAQNTELLGKIGNLNEQNEELVEKAKMSARGITSMYSYNGAKRQTHGGNVNVVVDEEFGIFQQMLELIKAKDLPNLIKLCEKQIEKTPDWFTPYLFLGVAQADMGLKDEAIKNIRHAVDNTPGDPDYAEARKILERLEQQP